jgi:hypothetical protein
MTFLEVQRAARRVTTRPWLDEYLASIRRDMSHRGRPRSAGGAAEAEQSD